MMAWQICDLTDRMGWGGRVAIGHGNKYSCLPTAELEALGNGSRIPGVAVSVLPATDIFTSGRHMEHSVMRGARRRQRAHRARRELLDRDQQRAESVHAVRRLLARADREHVRERRAARHGAGSGRVFRA